MYMQKNIFFIVAMLLVLGLGTYYFSSNKNSYKPSNSPTPATQTETIPAQVAPTSNTQEVTVARNSAIVIKNFSFNQSSVTVKVGTKVTWTNNDSVPHTITSDSGALLNSPVLSPGQSFSFTFVNSGTVNYHCKIHPSMRGSIIVEK